MSEIRAIAFFPWWAAINEPVTIGPVRLFPFAKGHSPGALPHISQDDIDGVFSAYANRPRHRVKNATLLEVDDWQTGQDPESSLQRLFLARDALGFAGLASRKLFHGHFGYCCFDNFALVVQRYQAGRTDTFAYTMRRRDGGSSNVWSSDEFAFQRPLHVNDPTRTNALDEALVCLLMDPATPPHWVESIREFNRANTDSTDIPLHVELVMMKSAFERLLDIDEKWQSFTMAVETLLPPARTRSRPAPSSCAQQWTERYPKSKRPIQAWGKEFCVRRGAAAHGNSGANAPVWSDHAHLALGSILFPLLLKKIAADAGRFDIDADDLDRLARIEQYLEHDPFDYRDDDEEDHTRHPWAEIDSDIHMRTLSHRLYPEAMAALEEGLAVTAAEEQVQ